MPQPGGCGVSQCVRSMCAYCICLPVPMWHPAHRADYILQNLSCAHPHPITVLFMKTCVCVWSSFSNVNHIQTRMNFPLTFYFPHWNQIHIRSNAEVFVLRTLVVFFCKSVYCAETALLSSFTNNCVAIIVYNDSEETWKNVFCFWYVSHWWRLAFRFSSLSYWITPVCLLYI